MNSITICLKCKEVVPWHAMTYIILGKKDFHFCIPCGNKLKKTFEQENINTLNEFIKEQQ